MACEVKVSLPLSPEEVAANRVPKFALSDPTKEPAARPTYATPMASKRRATPTSTPMVLFGEDVPKLPLMPDLVRSEQYSETSDKGHSERGQTSEQRTNLIYTLYTK